MNEQPAHPHSPSPSEDIQTDLKASGIPTTASASDSWTARFAGGTLEAGWLCALIVSPLFFNIHSSRFFEPDKVLVLRSIACLMLLAWVILGLERILSKTGKSPAGGVETLSLDVENRIRWLARLKSGRIVLYPALAWFVVQGFATVFSIRVNQSIWGSYARLQGFLTQLVYLLIFVSLVGLLRRRGQRERLLTVLLSASFPVALYGILQKVGWDPLPWEKMSQQRVISSLGNPIFLAAYLIMVVPLAGYRVWTNLWKISRRESTGIKWVLSSLVLINVALTIFAWNRSFLAGTLSIMVTLGLWVGQSVLLEKPRLPFLRLGVYMVILSTLMACLYFTGSRGPLLGLVAGILLLGLLWGAMRGKAFQVAGIGGAALALGGFLWILNFSTVPLGGLRQQPVIGRLGQLFEKSGQVRIQIWGGVEDLLADDALRTVIGRGPETMQLAYFPFYPAGLARVEGRNLSPDRAHNEIFDILVEVGAVGLAVHLWLIAALFLLGLRRLHLIRSSREKLFYLLAVAAGMACTVWGAHLADPEHSWRFLGVALPIGFSMGLGVYLIGFSCLASLKKIPPVPRMGRDPNKLFIATVLCGLLAHWIETDVGIAITVTRILFWIFAALLIVAPSSDRFGSTGEEEAANNSFENRVASPAALGLLLALILSSILYNFLTPEIFEKAKANMGWFLAMCISVLGLALFCDGNALRKRSDTGVKVVSLLMLLAAVLLPLAVFVALQRSHYSFPHPDTEFWFPPYFAAALLTMLAVGGVLAWTRAAASSATAGGRAMLRWVFYLPLAVGFFWAIHEWNAKPLQANTWHKQGTFLYKIRGQLDPALASYLRAIQRAPEEDYYYPSLGEVLLFRMNTTKTDSAAEEALLPAEEAFKKALDLNRMSPDHYVNLGRVYKHFADRVKDPRKRETSLRRAIPLYQSALAIQPVRVQWWNELAWIFALLGDHEKAGALLNQSLGIDNAFPQTWLILGDLHRKQGAWKKAEQAYRKGNELNPNLFRGQFLHGWALHRLHRIHESIAAFQRAESLAGKTRTGHGDLALLFSQAGNPAKALEHAQLALKRAKGNEVPVVEALIDKLEGMLRRKGRRNGANAER